MTKKKSKGNDTNSSLKQYRGQAALHILLAAGSVEPRGDFSRFKIRAMSRKFLETKVRQEQPKKKSKKNIRANVEIISTSVERLHLHMLHATEYNAINKKIYCER